MGFNYCIFHVLVHYVAMGFNACIIPVLDLLCRYGFQRLYISCFGSLCHYGFQHLYIFSAFMFTVSLWVSMFDFASVSLLDALMPWNNFLR